MGWRRLLASVADPVEVRLAKSRGVLSVDYRDAAGMRTMEFGGEFLRVYSPSAENGEWVRTVLSGGPLEGIHVVSGRRGVSIESLEPVGRYALRLSFNDGHTTGVYSFAYLYELGGNKFGLSRLYIRQLQALGLSRQRRKQSRRSDSPVSI